MALNFPSAPTVGQRYTAEGVTFVWNGTLWSVETSFPWATNAEGVAGTRSDVIMTPAAVAAALNAVTPGTNFNFGTPTDMSASRSMGVNYQNPRSWPMMVAASFSDRDSACEAEARIGPSNVNPPARNVGRAWANRGTPNVATIVFVVPVGWWYRMSIVSRRPGVVSWWEWR